MSEVLVLDAGPLSVACDPDTRKPDVRAMKLWIRRRANEGHELILPEIAAYEVSRELIRAGKQGSIARLERLKSEMRYLPIDTAAMELAAQFWAESRNRGRPTSDPRELDADCILAAQATAVGGTIVTENPGHLAQFVPVRSWRE